MSYAYRCFLEAQIAEARKPVAAVEDWVARFEDLLGDLKAPGFDKDCKFARSGIGEDVAAHIDDLMSEIRGPLEKAEEALSAYDDGDETGEREWAEEGRADLRNAA